jgi:hypothetical protein
MQDIPQAAANAVTAKPKQKQKPKSKAQKLRDIGTKKRQSAAEARQRCDELFDAGWKQIQI